MSDLRKAAEMALAKLDHLWEIGIDAEYKVELLPEIHALRQALAQPEQEPVCFIRETAWSYEIAPWDDPKGFPVYTAPPKREWVGLTDDEMYEIANTAVGKTFTNMASEIEAKLKEKNGG